MFDRGNRTEGPMSVQITLVSGRQFSGKFLLPAGRTLPEALNSPSTFMEFEPTGSQRIFISKSALESVAPLTVVACQSRNDRPTATSSIAQ